EQLNQRVKIFVVPRRGLEPPRLAALVPETSASASSATWASRRSGERQLVRSRAGLVKCAQARSIQPAPPRCIRGAQQTGTGMVAIPFETLVTVFGGSGFLGRHVVRALAGHGYRVRVAVRRPELAGHLQPLGRVGQIHAVQANLRNDASVEAAARDADVVIN